MNVVDVVGLHHDFKTRQRSPQIAQSTQWVAFPRGAQEPRAGRPAAIGLVETSAHASRFATLVPLTASDDLLSPNGPVRPIASMSANGACPSPGVRTRSCAAAVAKGGVRRVISSLLDIDVAKETA